MTIPIILFFSLFNAGMFYYWWLGNRDYNKKPRERAVCNKCVHYVELKRGFYEHVYHKCGATKKEHFDPITGKVTYTYPKNCLEKNKKGNCKDFAYSDTAVEEMEDYLNQAVKERKNTKKPKPHPNCF